MLQKVTFVGIMMVDIPEELTVVGAKRNLRQALDQMSSDQDYGLHFRRLLNIKIVEEDS